MLPKLLYYHCVYLKITLWDLYNFIFKKWSKFLIFLYEDKLHLFHLMDAFILYDVSIKPGLVISWWGSDGGIEGWGMREHIIWEFLHWLRKLGMVHMVKNVGSKDIIYQPLMSMFSWTILIQSFPKSGRFPPRDHSC